MADATKSKAAPPTTKRSRVKTQVLTISADQFLAGVKRFDNACRIIEGMGPSLNNSAPLQHSPADIQSGARLGESNTNYPQSLQDESLLQMLEALNDQAAALFGVSSQIRSSILGPEIEDGGSVGIPSRGPLKDRATCIRELLSGVHRNLDAIANYIISN